MRCARVNDHRGHWYVTTPQATEDTWCEGTTSPVLAELLGARPGLADVGLFGRIQTLEVSAA